MFKNIGIYVREKSVENIDSSSLDALILSLKKHTSDVFIDETSKFKNNSLAALKHDEFVSKVDLLIVFGGDGEGFRNIDVAEEASDVQRLQILLRHRLGRRARRKQRLCNLDVPQLGR